MNLIFSAKLRTSEPQIDFTGSKKKRAMIHCFKESIFLSMLLFSELTHGFKILHLCTPLATSDPKVHTPTFMLSWKLEVYWVCGNKVEKKKIDDTCYIIHFLINDTEWKLIFRQCTHWFKNYMINMLFFIFFILLYTYFR